VTNLSLNREIWNWKAVGERSEALLGSPHRLGVALLVAAAEPDELYAARIADAAGIDRRQAARELEDFRRAEVLVLTGEQHREGGRGRPGELMERRETETWKALQALGERFRREPQRD
jgi:hypothetical protein